jgi:rare lipoprotein A
MKTPFLSVILTLISLAYLSFLTGCSHVPTKISANVYYGKASYYDSKHHGKLTANGEVYDKNKLTCAHNELPFETICKVTNLANGKSVFVRVNDRGPFIGGRIMDLSYKAMETIDGIEAGTIDVRVEIIE